MDPEDVIPRSKRVHWEPDQVHFTPSGSQALGAHLAHVVARILNKLGHNPAPAPHTSSYVPSKQAAMPRTSNFTPSKQMFHKPAHHQMMGAPHMLRPMVRRGGA
jgi:hypothetical protein